MVRVNVELDLPPGVELLGQERSGDGHGFEVKFPLPDSCRCDECGHEERLGHESRDIASGPECGAVIPHFIPPFEHPS